jgi:hypothetical protein
VRVGKPGNETAASDVPEAATNFVAGLMRSIRPQPLHPDVLAFREQIELYTVMPDTPFGEVHDYRQAVYDLTYNATKLGGLVALYEETSNPYALRVLLTILENALALSKPIPKPIAPLLRDWVHDGLKKKRAADPLILSRDSSLVAAILVLEGRWGVKPYRNSASGHKNSGFDIAASTWNVIAAERNAGGETCPTATYDAARDAWRAYQKQQKQGGGDSSSE